MTGHATRLRELAGRVGRLGLAGRWDPEKAFGEREDVARALTSLASVIEITDAPAECRSAAPHHDRCRRLEVLVAHKSAEVRKLSRLLASARPPTRRRLQPLAGQLSLQLD